MLWNRFATHFVHFKNMRRLLIKIFEVMDCGCLRRARYLDEDYDFFFLISFLSYRTGCLQRCRQPFTSFAYSWLQFWWENEEGAAAVCCKFLLRLSVSVVVQDHVSYGSYW